MGLVGQISGDPHQFRRRGYPEQGGPEPHHSKPSAFQSGTGVFYSYFAALGLDIRTEDSTNHGRIDMAVLFGGQVYLFEFKVVEETPAGKALQQLRDMGYADKYRALGHPIHLIGVEFSKVDRNIVGFEVETRSL